ncbi:ATP-binding response regulator [Gloeothece verrucosa]|uniref:histidine kinase n=1 Tax=Gloeothece verrucosa (strain PCC 7822) TaxID=497965 RepID=E0U998_GLOV7|nr:ATP-binding protein [Gloeothece verrucosa]ADN17356.1 GAF sensor hybrid histidine kinase [Gloeothece verrucosa PCC 7822]
MDSSQVFVFRRKVSQQTLSALCRLLEQISAHIGQEAILLTQETLFPEQQRGKNPWGTECLQLLIAPQMSILLLGNFSVPDSLYQISLTWDSQTIQDLLTQLTPSVTLPQELEQYLTQSQLSPVVGAIKEFNLFFSNLLEIFWSEGNETPQMKCIHASVCQPIEEALRQQVEQERLLNQVITQIRHSLELPVVLETAVTEVRNFLQVDRLLIYQFSSHPSETETKQTFPNGWGKITYEARASQLVPSLLNMIPEDDCFSYLPQYQDKYRRGTVVAVENVETQYSSSFCLTEFLRHNQVLSLLIAPIIVEDQLWGLIIAHQCFKKRQWLETEKEFLGHIGEHLAIAIQQALLYKQVQEQKQFFEKRVFECTEELRSSIAVAQSAHLSKSEFLSNISHELLTPLTCVIGLAGTLLHWSGEQSSLSPEKQRKYIESIQKNGKKLMDLINDILDYSSITSGDYQLNIHEFSLYSVVNSVLRDFASEAQKKSIDLILDFQVQKEENDFYADRERIKQILSHLISNAIKFTPDQGKVTLRIWREKSQVFFQVEDTGIGISQEQLPLLFEKFQQLEKARQRTHGGTGLGLALTKQLVELHRGTIEVESTPEQGSLFTVRIPNNINLKNKKLLTNETNNVNKSAQNKTIILISKDEEAATLICELLTVKNYQVIWLLDSYPSIRQIEILQPLIVIIDQEIIQSQEIGKALKHYPKTSFVKVLVLRTSLQNISWKSLVKNGIDDYLIKPIEPTILLRKISFLGSLAIHKDKA